MYDEIFLKHTLQVIKGIVLTLTLMSLENLTGVHIGY